MSERPSAEMTEDERFVEVATLLAEGAVRFIRRRASLAAGTDRSPNRDRDESRRASE